MADVTASDLRRLRQRAASARSLLQTADTHRELAPVFRRAFVADAVAELRLLIDELDGLGGAVLDEAPAVVPLRSRGSAPTDAPSTADTSDGTPAYVPRKDDLVWVWVSDRGELGGLRQRLGRVVNPNGSGSRVPSSGKRLPVVSPIYPATSVCVELVDGLPDPPRGYSAWFQLAELTPVGNCPRCGMARGHGHHLNCAIARAREELR
jgi:hypothetical protein